MRTDFVGEIEVTQTLPDPHVHADLESIISP